MKKATNKGAVMRKKVTLILLLGFFSLCTQTQNDVEKIMEDGVEVIINHNKPYKVEGKPVTLSLEEEFIIDLEKGNIAVLGLTDIWGFDVDSEGNIYFFKSPMSQGDLIFKFDPKGNFVSSFTRRGQGAGEVENPSYQKINNRDELPIIESGLSKIMLFNKDGNFIKEIHMDINIGFMGNMVYPLENGNYLIRRSLRSEIEGRLDFVLNDPFFTPGAPLDSWVTKKRDRLYVLRMKSSGYKEFVVYKATWE